MRVHRRYPFAAAVLLAAWCGMAGPSRGQAVEAERPAASVGRTPLALPIGKNHFVMSLAADAQGNLWLGTEGEGVYRYNARSPESAQWTQFSPKDGLGDEYGYALACDKRGRIWVGHVNHGVSVFNGQKWQNYESVAELSRRGSRAGPLGERVTAIAVNPVDGDVWMATNAGLARYHDATDDWTYFTRFQGLPADQATSLAFDADGTLYVGMQCDGIAIAGPADDFKTWKKVQGPDTLPVVGKGKGLPTNQINALCVARDHTVYAATSLGLAWSVDKGANWEFVRGKQWVAKVEQRFDGPPANWVPPVERDPDGVILNEDFATAVAEDLNGNILVGHQATAGDLLAPKAARKIRSTENVAVTSLVPIRGNDTRNMYAGTNGQGLIVETLDLVDRAASAQLPLLGPLTVARLPAGAVPRISKLPAAPPEIDDTPAAKVPPLQFIGEDWMTQGDWVGRYGRQYAVHCAENSPGDGIYTTQAGMAGVQNQTDPAFKARAPVMRWLEGLSSDHPSSLWAPLHGVRRESQWNDHGEAGEPLAEGPNLWLTMPLPEGTYRVSLYFFQFRAHSHALDREYRDFYLRAGFLNDNGPFEEYAHTRVSNFSVGVYKQFLVQGGKTLRFIIERRHGYSVIVNGIFIDRLAAPGKSWTSETLSCMGAERLAPPEPPPLADLPKDLRDIIGASTFDALRPPTLETLDRALCVRRYRVAQDADVADSQLAGLRWSVPLWTAKDRTDWSAATARGFKNFLEMNPNRAEQLRRGDP
jgi:hypothetical protein